MRLVFVRYTLDELLSQCDASADLTAEDRVWLDTDQGQIEGNRAHPERRRPGPVRRRVLGRHRWKTDFVVGDERYTSPRLWLLLPAWRLNHKS